MTVDRPGTRRLIRRLILVIRITTLCGLVLLSFNLQAGRLKGPGHVVTKPPGYSSQPVGNHSHISRDLRPRKAKRADGSACIHASEVLFNKILVSDHIVAIKGGKITGVFPASNPARNRCFRIEFYSGLLVPGFIDIHIHGAAGEDVMNVTSQKPHCEICCYGPQRNGIYRTFKAGKAFRNPLFKCLTRYCYEPRDCMFIWPVYG